MNNRAILKYQKLNVAEIKDGLVTLKCSQNSLTLPKEVVPLDVDGTALGFVLPKRVGKVFFDGHEVDLVEEEYSGADTGYYLYYVSDFSNTGIYYMINYLIYNEKLANYDLSKPTGDLDLLVHRLNQVMSHRVRKMQARRSEKPHYFPVNGAEIEFEVNRLYITKYLAEGVVDVEIIEIEKDLSNYYDYFNSSTQVECSTDNYGPFFIHSNHIKILSNG